MCACWAVRSIWGLAVLCRMLGPLEVRAGGDWASMGAPKWRALLAALVTTPGQVVPTERLIDELWGDSPPPGARKLVSGYVLGYAGWQATLMASCWSPRHLATGSGCHGPT